MTTSISPVITNVSSTSPLLLTSSPQRVHSSSPTASSVHTTTIPLALITNSNPSTTSIANTSNSKIVSNQNIIVSSSVTSSTQPQILKKVLPNGLTTHSNGLTTAHPISINFSGNDGISPALLAATNAAMPLNLNITTNSVSASNGLQIINATPSLSGKNGIRQAMEISDQGTLFNGNHAKEQKNWNSMSSKLDSEPPTKVFKLINGNTIALASVDKDNKLIPSNQLTLSVVSQIPLSSQAVRVIGQTPNGLSTIELSNPNGRCIYRRIHIMYVI